MKVAILGSCVSRDAFGLHEDLLGSPHRYFARSALASAMCARPFPGVDTATLASKFQRETVRTDLDKGFLPWLATADFDLLIVDSIEERFALLIAADGTIATRSSELVATGADLSGHRMVRPNSEEFFERWADAWERLVAAIDRVGARDRVRVNRVRWADTFDGPGAEFPAFYSAERIRRANRFLVRAYARMERDLAPGQFYRYTDDELRAGTGHQWGAAPFHYTPAFYRRFVEHVTGAPVPEPRRGLREKVGRFLPRRTG